MSVLLLYWRWIAGAGVALGVAFAVWHHVHHDKVTAAQLVKSRAELTQAHADNALWAKAYHDEKRAVDLQNAAITRMASDARDWEQRAQAATQAAHEANLAAQAAAADFLKRQPKGATVCERVDDVADQIRREQ